MTGPVPAWVRLRRDHFSVASTASSNGIDTTATSQPHHGGLAWSRPPANQGTSSTVSAKASSIDTVTSSIRLVVQPSAPGQRVVLRQANALADWASTTVMKAAPDAAAIAALSGHGVCGPHP